MTPKYLDWCARHPDKAKALQKVVAERLGMRFGIKSELGQRAVDEWCVAVLSALLGWHLPDPEPPRAKPEVPEEVINTFDLETQR